MSEAHQPLLSASTPTSPVLSQDHVGGSRSNPTTPQKRERGSPVRSIRRTATGEPQRCANCGSEHTCLWRRDKGDPTRTLCNACGIYKTNNGIDRPTNGLFPSWKNGKERVVRRNVSHWPACNRFTCHPGGETECSQQLRILCGRLHHMTPYYILQQPYLDCLA